MLALSTDRRLLLHEGRSFDPWALAWREGAPYRGESRDVGPLEAMAWVFAQPKVRRVPLAVIGPKAASPRQREIAEQLGRRVAELGLTMITGGRGGVMEAASRGHLSAGGQPIALLPDEEWQSANDFVAVPIATGLGAARNAIIARAAFALIAVGGEYGTQSEMVLGLHFGRLVVALEDAPQVAGAHYVGSLEDALERVARRLLSLEG